MLLAIVAVLGGLFCVAGYMMAADFTIADSANFAHWRQVAMIYVAMFGVSVLLLLVAVSGLWLRRRRTTTVPA